VREWIQATGVDNIGKRLVNSREGRVEFDKPAMPLSTLMHYGEAAAPAPPPLAVVSPGAQPCAACAMCMPGLVP
jgi:hypothetical protein